MPAQQQSTPAPAAAQAAPAQTSAAPPAVDFASPGAVQALAGGGNAMAASVAQNGPSPAAALVDPKWPQKSLIAVQTELKRLGLYTSTIDGLYGRGTSAALVEAFGSDEWRTMAPDAVVARLKAAAAPTGDAAQRHFRYGEMFKDGVLDMTLGIGFDEGGSHLAAIETFENVLQSHGFTSDAGLAASLYAQAGRSLGPSAFGMFFVRPDALTFKPPAGPERKVHAVVRLVVNQDGDSGAEAAGAFEEGMADSDVAYYSGHGRYGSGPDFDRNMSFELLDEHGAVSQSIDDYEVLERVLKQEGAASRRDAWAQFQWRVQQHRINVIGSNEGNVFLNPESLHDNEFGGKLMYWNLKRTGGQGAVQQTGANGELAHKNAEHPEHKYNVMVFDGCRTRDYVKSIRSTPGMDAKSNDVLATNRTLNWGDEANTLAAFLDGILGQQSAQAVVTNMDAKQSPENAGGQWGHAYQDF